VNQTTNALETSTYRAHHSIQVTYSAKHERSRIYVDGDMQYEDFWRLQPLPVKSILPALNNELQYGGLFWTQHEITDSEASYFHKDYQESFPKEPVFVLRLPFAVIITTFLFMVLGKVGSVIYKSDPPDYLGIYGIGFGVLDFTSDYQLAYRLYSIQDDLWLFVVSFSVLAYVANLVFLIKWWRAKITQDNILAHWLNKYRKWTLFLIVLAGSHTTILRFAYVRLSPKLYAQYFRMPISLEQKKAINRGKFITVICEDIPLLVFQTMLLNRGFEDEDANTSWAVSIALLTSIIAIVQTGVEFIASPHSLKFLKHQWVQFSYPNFDIGLRQNSIRRMFSRLFRGTTTDVIVCDLRKNHYRLLFQYSHKSNTLGEQIDIHDKILECLAKYFEPGVSSILFESPPKLRKVVNGLCELSQDFGGESGSLNISSESGLHLRLPNIDEHLMKQIMDRTSSDGVISLEVLKKLKNTLDKTFQRETLDETKKQTRVSITTILSRHDSTRSMKKLNSDLSIRDLPQTLQLLNHASSIRSTPKVTATPSLIHTSDAVHTPINDFEGGASYLETDSMIEMTGVVVSACELPEESLSESNPIIGTPALDSRLPRSDSLSVSSVAKEAAQEGIGGAAFDGPLDVQKKRGPDRSTAARLPTPANTSRNGDS